MEHVSELSSNKMQHRSIASELPAINVQKIPKGSSDHSRMQNPVVQRKPGQDEELPLHRMPINQSLPLYAFRFVQPKLSVNQPGDQYEQEADAMADKVMRMKDSLFSTDTQIKHAFTPVQRKCAACEEEEKQVHRKQNDSVEISGSNELDNYVGSLGSSGQALSESSRQFFEPRFGQNFSNVRIHTGSVAAKSAQSINALAYTAGNNIVFNSGQYSPGTESGQRLLAHELTHVVQQNQIGQITRRKIQCKYIDENNAGCGVCLEAEDVGDMAHDLVQSEFGELASERHLFNNDTSGDGRLDLVRVTRSSSPPYETFVEIGEIKPNNFKGIKDGYKQLAEYRKIIQGSQSIDSVSSANFEVSFLDDPAPQASMLFQDPLSKCPPQELIVETQGDGLYLYSCLPPKSEYSKEECCSGQKELEKQPLQLPVPFIPAIPVTAAEGAEAGVAAAEGAEVGLSLWEILGLGALAL